MMEKEAIDIGSGIAANVAGGKVGAAGGAGLAKGGFLKTAAAVAASPLGVGLFVLGGIIALEFWKGSRDAKKM